MANILRAFWPRVKKEDQLLRDETRSVRKASLKRIHGDRSAERSGMPPGNTRQKITSLNLYNTTLKKKIRDLKSEGKEESEIWEKSGPLDSFDECIESIRLIKQTMKERQERGEENEIQLHMSAKLKEGEITKDDLEQDGEWQFCEPEI